MVRIGRELEEEIYEPVEWPPRRQEPTEDPVEDPVRREEEAPDKEKAPA